ENIAFDHRVAGPFQRLPAYLLDLLIRCMSFLILCLVGVLALGFQFGVAWSLVLYFVLYVFYGGFFETVWNGQTPGKRLLRLRVVTINGEPINGTQAVLRNVLRIVDGFPPATLMIPLAFLEVEFPLIIPTFQVALFATMATSGYQ